jgi:endoglucanase
MQMAPGINLGNTLEAVHWAYDGVTPYTTSQEGIWGNGDTNQATFDGYAAAGFKSVRIPVAYTQYSDTTTDEIAPFWLDRVQQVVDYARNAGLYVMINIHWDGGWMNHTDYAHQAEVEAKLTKFWTQIANRFKDYDDHLLFAGMNEVGQDGASGAPTSEFCTVQHGYNQTFVNAVRATGGNNATRYLVVQAYWTNTDYALLCNATMPTDSISGHLAIETHEYSPYHFTLDGDSNIWQWGKDATDPTAVETWANEAYIDGVYDSMKTHFIDKGVPVVVGEYGAYLKPKYPGMAPYRKYWAEYVTRSIYTHNAVPMWWDTGELFDRATGAEKVPDVIDAIVDSAK